MKKRILSSLLALGLSLALALPAAAAPSSVPVEEALQAITALGILDRSSGQASSLSQSITRAEFTAMAVKAAPGGGQVGQAATSPYPDVPKRHWAAGFVEAGISMGLVSGFSDGTFRPEESISLAEGASMALTLLGYGPEDFSGTYPSGQLALYHNLRLDRGVSASAPLDALSRQDAVYLFYNLLSAPTKEGAPYLTALGHSLDASGNVDLLSLVNGEMEGPLVACEGWEASLPFAPGSILRGGAYVSPENIQAYDVLYWNASMGAVWAYTQKATGAVQAIEVSGGSPISVTVAGHTYSIETSTAAYSLSTLGQYGLGDSVTLLLGRSGGVAAVTDISASAGDRVGIVVEESSASYPDGNGGSYQARTLTVLSTDGQRYQYQADSGFREGSVVRATVDETGQVVLRTLNTGSLTGTVDSGATKLGSYPFAQDVQILDVSGAYGAVIYPSRLAGVTLDKDSVRYYSLNGLGQIETLILQNVTGDMYQYGVLTEKEALGEGMGATYSYRYDIGGVSHALDYSTTGFPASVGPIQLLGETTNPDRIYSLTSTPKGEIVGHQFRAGNWVYTLSDQVAVYERRDGSYHLSSLSRVQDGSFTLTAWYDKAEKDGGRIRVIVARPR